MVIIKNKEKTTLYIKDNTGNIRIWGIEVENNQIIITHGQLGGIIQVKTEDVPFGKGGRSRDDQIISRVASRISKQMDKGYVLSLTQAEKTKPVNTLGLEKPMLAKRFDQLSNVDLDNSFIQRKYNGHRCIITKRNNKMIAYSRQGKLIRSIEHIVAPLSHQISEGESIDGELYSHGIKLQTISSWIKREQPESKLLNYVMYDAIMDNSYKERLDRLLEIQTKNEAFMIAPTKYANLVPSIRDELKASLMEGYEGLIIRQGLYGYEDGKRSNSLVKLKQCLDDEYLVVDVEESVDGWGILVCELYNGETFKVTAPGTMADKYAVADDPESYIGQFVHVEYFDLTIKGKPFHPVATHWTTTI